jgi:hypothetical protein
MPPDDKAPRWLIPLLAALLVLRSGRHQLRSLDDSGFRQVARGCDRFLIAATVPGFALSALLLPSAAGGWVLLATSMWGMVAMLLVGRRVALERRRRRRLAGLPPAQ